jgi:hypothetical protein
VKVLLDENFRLGLFRILHLDGLPAEHIITLGWRGHPTRGFANGFKTITCCS